MQALLQRPGHTRPAGPKLSVGVRTPHGVRPSRWRSDPAWRSTFALAFGLRMAFDLRVGVQSSRWRSNSAWRSIFALAFGLRMAFDLRVGVRTPHGVQSSRWRSNSAWRSTFALAFDLRVGVRTPHGVQSSRWRSSSALVLPLPGQLGDESCKKCNIFRILRARERGMLYFVQQFGRDGLETREYRPKCCTFYNNEQRMRVIAPFLLYKIQHLLTYLENSAISHEPNFQHRR